MKTNEKGYEKLKMNVAVAVVKLKILLLCFTTFFLKFLVISQKSMGKRRWMGWRDKRERVKERTYRALEDVDSVGDSGRAWGIQGISRDSEGFEGPACKSNNLGEARRDSSHESHSLSLKTLSPLLQRLAPTQLASPHNLKMALYPRRRRSCLADVNTAWSMDW